MDNISNDVFNSPVWVLSKGLFPEHDDVSLARYLFSTLSLAVARISQNEEMVVGFHLHPQEINFWKYDSCIHENIIPLNININSATSIVSFIQNMMNWMTPDAIQQENNIGARVLTLEKQQTLHDLFDLELTWQPPVDNQPVQALVCHVASNEEAFMLTLRFNPARFNAVQVEKLPVVWRQIIAFAAKNGAETVADIRLIDDAECQRVLHSFNQTDRVWRGETNIVTQLKHRAQHQPEQTAVIFRDQQLSYQQLYRQAGALAHYLNAQNVNSECCVGLFVEPSLTLMTGVWGILLSGNAYLPLSPEYPEDRLAYMLENSQTRIVVTQPHLREQLLALSPQGIQVVTPDDVDAFMRQHAHALPDAPAIDISPYHLAYVIYTSGSTGKPKGVMIEHHSVLNQMNWLAQTFALDKETVILQKTPMSFDAAQWEILSPACGCQVVMGEPGVYRNPEHLVDMLAEYQVTTLQCVPTLLQALLDTERLADCPALRQIFSGGEALQKHLALECLETLPDCELVNLYGPTECTINSSAFRVEPTAVRQGPDTLPIGTPIANTRYYILDNCCTPVAVGQTGELYIGGDGVARGYLNREDLTAECFIADPFAPTGSGGRLYKTGDLASWNDDGTVQYAGRADNQIKLRGYRVELDEIRSAIETHDWVKAAAVIVRNDPFTGYQNLIAFIELNAREAVLMDQGRHGVHHQSKANKAQVMLQLANQGCREFPIDSQPYTLDLPGKQPDEKQRRTAFSRKTYRFYDGGVVRRDDILSLLQEPLPAAVPRRRGALTLDELGHCLRYLGQFTSAERLLPKYAYASPGALYATQVFLELNGVAGVSAGYYYYQPVQHQLIRVSEQASVPPGSLRLHFVGKKSAIEPIYKNNIREVLQIEMGHIIGLLDKILPDYGLGVVLCDMAALNPAPLAINPDDDYLGACDVQCGTCLLAKDDLDIYVQTTGTEIADLPVGTYRYVRGDLQRIADDIIKKKHVIAINQAVYERSSFGISLVSRSEGWPGYVHVGRTLQRLQMNDMNIGLMSSGYSSETGNDLPAARRFWQILGHRTGPYYFFIGGRISDEQKYSEGMKEDMVHMKGPAEMVRDDLAAFMPDYMMPNKLLILDEMPLTVNGKIDMKALANINVELRHKTIIAPRNPLEHQIMAVWQAKLKRETISVDDNFFESGGNSLIAVSLIHELNATLNASLPLQVLFQAPTVEKLATWLSRTRQEPVSRLVRLQPKGRQMPVYCWPGLGGYCMNLRLLARRMGSVRPFFGIQAHGINPGEVPYATISEMAARDIELIRQHQPHGPYTLWGYSFGARVAFEAAWQLEQVGEVVDNLFLLAPGSPKLRDERVAGMSRTAGFDNPGYLTILFSVFIGSITDPALERCLETVRDEESFVAFITGLNPALDDGVVRRIIRIVAQTFEFTYTFRELEQRQLNAPVTIIQAQGDDYSFIENHRGFSALPPTVLALKADHYSMLKEPGIAELISVIHANGDMTA
ncbi:amino acid adenylation domain-containing protein [Dickeya sp. CFBP 2040]|uniref:amino acid adenylation domain-containing protein n=1 Tax=Dickeya sp. CFBP 2040 TaxID=2718531 RepID=UPI001448642F|nr:amino acid adenylation domain-containing protein [Dickeya sp. CFBP 2040]NKI74734.1 amino acid adenylation domain-containing protein [Dickeya sp. CFBP 2040]